jgi:hypothetical protein
VSGTPAGNRVLAIASFCGLNSAASKLVCDVW